ncbi:MAG: marine proteobacterial sortase target protein [Gammaproteobacteria bacterium]|nr:marine proteobacterial sortase target protein [Gammaproteobacteria bacterium]
MHRRKIRLLAGRALTTAWMLIAAASALASEIKPEQVQSGSLLLRMQQGYRVATLMNTDVEMKISGLVARVKVRQEFENTGQDWVEGIYVFPLPDKAAVDRMRLHIGDRFIEGEIREKEKARKEYERAKAEGKKASLIEQQRPNMFTTSVANIAPGERVVVEIEYLEDLQYANGMFSLRFPMTLTPRYIPGTPLPDRQGSGWSADTTQVDNASLISPPMVANSSAHRASIQIDLNVGVPLEIIASRYHPVNVAQQSGRYDIVLAGQTVPMDQDFELIWKPLAAAAPQAMAFTETIDGEPHYLLMVMPPSTESAAKQLMPREMIFIIDTSGSMHGTSIGQAKKALGRALKRLRAGDRFNVIAFSSQPNALFPTSVAVDSGSMSAADAFVASLQANGGTEMRAALELALGNPPAETHLRQVVFITDGAVGNEDELFKLIDRRLGNGRLFTVGIGSAPNSWFMRKAAETGRGTYTMISALNEVGERMDLLFGKIEQPQVTNISIDWPSGVIVDAYPDVVPDLYVNEPVSVKAKISGVVHDTDVVGISGNTVNGAWVRELAIADGADSPGVAALWARARIGELMDMGRRGADASEIRDEVVSTALKHHLVSKYTSLIAVDKTPARVAGELLRRDQVPNRMAYGQSSHAIFGFPATATNAAQLQLFGAACMLAAMFMLLLGRVRRRGQRALAQ